MNSSQIDEIYQDNLEFSGYVIGYRGCTNNPTEQCSLFLGNVSSLFIFICTHGQAENSGVCKAIIELSQGADPSVACLKKANCMGNYQNTQS